MQLSIRLFREHQLKLFIAGAILIVLSFVLAGHVSADNDDAARDGRLVTFHDRGEERVILTHALSVEDALKDAAITTTSKDIVEPALDSELVTTNYTVNVYRARPVIVVDGMVRQKVVTAEQTPRDIVTNANITKLQKEDKVSFAASENMISDGASTILTIDRAIPFTLQMYGKPIPTHSHAETVGDMLEQKGVKLASDDKVSVAKDTPLTANMTVAVWRDGIQTTTLEEPIAYSSKQVIDVDQLIGYRKVQTAGVNGLKNVTYQITAQGGREISRKVIQSVVIDEAQPQIEVVGGKPGAGALSKSKGAQHFTDSKGVSHRETYYDLPMNVVMGACGGGGYTVRPDGAKVDKDGYILIAAHLGNYPRCSIVETSMGLGKVYDTGGFTTKHPHGFDLATDWTKADGI